MQIVAEPALLEQTTVINTAPVDVTGAEADVVRTVPLLRPNGVTVVGVESATVRVAVQPLQGQQVRDVAVTVQNVPEGRTASVVPGVVQVTLSGPQPALARLQVSDVVATANMEGLGEGTQSVPVTARVGVEGIQVDRVSPERVNVTLSQPPAAAAAPGPHGPAPSGPPRRRRRRPRSRPRAGAQRVPALPATSAGHPRHRRRPGGAIRSWRRVPRRRRRDPAPAPGPPAPRPLRPPPGAARSTGAWTPKSSTGTSRTGSAAGSRPWRSSPPGGGTIRSGGRSSTSSPSLRWGRC